MTPENFCYWMKGFVELSEYKSENVPPSIDQWRSILDHLELVFDKVTPEIPKKTPPPYILQQMLQPIPSSSPPTIEC